jgi:3-dehydroquinate synthase
MISQRVQVPPRAYEVHIENGLLSRAGEQLRSVLKPESRLFVLTVAPVRRKWGKTLSDSLTRAGFPTRLLTMPEGERHKRLKTVEGLADQLSRLGADRNAVIVAFGGGIAGDVGGVLASLYMRGVDFVQIPTTVLAQVDASIGGKTGVNLAAGKNLLGTFHQPQVVLIDPLVLSSLPAREYRAGLYESLKAGIIGDAGLFERFEGKRDAILHRDAATVERIIAASVKLKADVVSADEREYGLRRVLNLGHTIGHALEAETEYKRLLHGEAVAWGMLAVARVALALDRLDRTTSERITAAILSLGKLPKLEIRGRNILKRLHSDKKTRNGRVHFVLPVAIGQVEIVSDVPEEIVLTAVEEIRRLSLSQ